MLTATEMIRALDLEPLPEEGGFYRETFRDALMLDVKPAGRRLPLRRCAGTSILYLITRDSFSALHRVWQTEVFHYYKGDAAEFFLLDESGDGAVAVLGNEIEQGQQPQLAVPGGHWQGARLQGDEFGWSLMGATVAPGFEFEDFQLADRAELLASHPRFSERIGRYTRE